MAKMPLLLLLMWYIYNRILTMILTINCQQLTINHYIYTYIYIHIYMYGWWYTYPSEKNEFVSWEYDIPNIWKIKFMFQTTNQYIHTYLCVCLCVCLLTFLGLFLTFPSLLMVNYSVWNGWVTWIYHQWGSIKLWLLNRGSWMSPLFCNQWLTKKTPATRTASIQLVQSFPPSVAPSVF